MVALSTEYEPDACEREARAVWRSRRFPALDGTIGTATGPRVWQFEGSFAPGDREELVAQRAVAADVDARYLALTGRRAIGTLRRESFRGVDAEKRIGPLLASLGIWTGGTGERPWDAEGRHDVVQRIVSRLAEAGLFIVHDGPLRICPSCSTPRSPERIIYQEEYGPTFLVRFAVRRGEREAHALAWIDAPWRLLGTSALLVNPDLVYVLARHRRKGIEELIVTSRSSIPRLRGWIGGAEFEILEEFPGRDLEGVPYGYPLRHEFPMGGTLTPPAGTLQSSREVGDTGTGIVPLVPGHGGTDAQIAEKLGVSGWPLVTSRGVMDLMLMHKYSGLDLRTTDEFVVRDIAEGGTIFAELKVRRGVPHCAICGTSMVWTPSRTWCLEPGRLPAELVDQYARLLPDEPPLSQVEIAAWPVSESTTSTDPVAVALRECSACARLGGPDGPETCRCGARTRPITRRLLPSIGGTLGAWARQDPLPVADSVHLYVGARRRAPAVVHHLTAIAGLDAPVGEIGLTLLPTVVSDDLPKLIAEHGADSVRAALIRIEDPSSAGASLAERCVQERRRLEQWWRFAHDVLAACDTAQVAEFSRPVQLSLGELEPIDLAFVARWERSRARALAHYDRWAAAAAHRELFRFLETDLTLYRSLVKDRLRIVGSPASKRAALRTLVHVLRGSTSIVGPISPHVAEVVHRVLVSHRSSLFDEPPMGIDRTLLNEDRARGWDRWRSVVLAMRRFRATYGLAPETILPTAALVVGTDAIGELYRADRAILESLTRIAHLEVGSPDQPWTGRRRELRPIEPEIQRTYPQMASQMMALLRRVPPKRFQDASSTADLSVVVGSNSYKILPSMVGFEDLLPDRLVPVPWRNGELYAEVPARPGPAPHAPPPLSADAFWLVLRLQHRLRRPGRLVPLARTIVVVSAKDPLAGELSATRAAIACYLGLEELRVTSAIEEGAPPGRVTGRTRTGAGWWFHIPGSAAVPRPKKRPTSHPHAPRVPTNAVEPSTANEDFADEAKVAEAEAIRSLGQQLDLLLGVPLLGPAKVAGAWGAGLRTVEAYGDAPFDQLAALPGFGIPLAETLREKLGRVNPPRVRRSPRSRSVPPVLAPGRGSSSPRPARVDPSPAPDRAPLAVEVPIEPPAAPLPPLENAPEPAGSESPTEPTPESDPTATGSETMPAEIATELLPPTSPPNGSPSPPASKEQAEPAPSRPPPPDTVPVPELSLAPPERRDAEPLPSESSEGPESPETRTDEHEPLVGVDPSAGAAPHLLFSSDTPGSSHVDPREVVGGGSPAGLEVDQRELDASTSPAHRDPGPTGPEPAASHAPPADAELSLPPAEFIGEARGPLSAPVEGAPEPSDTAPLVSGAVSSPIVEIPASGIELDLGLSLLPSLQKFLDATAAGHHGICLVRESPERIRAHVGSRPVEIFWLSNLGRGPSLKPGDLDGLGAFLDRSLSEKQVTAFFVEGIEYLVQLHGIDRVIDLLTALDRSARAHEARAWVHLHPDLIAPADRARIVGVFGFSDGTVHPPA